MPAVLIFRAFPTFGLATGAGEGLNHRVRFGGWGLETSSYAVGIDRNDAAKPTQKAGEAAAHVQAVSSGRAKGRCGRLCATLSLPVHQEGRHPSFLR